MTVDIGEAEIAPLVTVGKFSMINPKQVEDGGIKIVNMHGVGCPMIFIWPDHISIPVGQVVTVLVGLSISDPWLDPTPSHPGGKGTG